VERELVAMRDVDRMEGVGVAFAVLDRADAWLDEASEPRLRLMHAFGLNLRAAILSEAPNRQNDAIAALDDLIARFGNDADPAIQKLVNDARDERQGPRLSGLRQVDSPSS
jgi:hypothetical protein